MGNWKKDGTGLFSVATGNGQQGKFWLNRYRAKNLYKQWCSTKTWTWGAVKYPPLEILKTQLDTALSNVLCIWSWPRSEQEGGWADLGRQGPFSPEFCDPNVPHDMCAKIRGALHISSLVSGIVNTFISWNAAELTQTLKALSKHNYKGTWHFLCISISLVPCVMTFKISWLGGLFPTQFRVFTELAWCAVKPTEAYNVRPSLRGTLTNVRILAESKQRSHSTTLMNQTLKDECLLGAHITESSTDISLLSLFCS